MNLHPSAVMGDAGMHFAVEEYLCDRLMGIDNLLESSLEVQTPLASACKYKSTTGKLA